MERSRAALAVPEKFSPSHFAPRSIQAAWPPLTPDVWAICLYLKQTLQVVTEHLVYLQLHHVPVRRIEFFDAHHQGVTAVAATSRDAHVARSF